MGVNLSIKGVPDAMAARLRERAERNHRSLQGELMAIIERAVSESSAPALSRPFASTPANEGTTVGSRTIEEIAVELRKRFPTPIKGGPLAVDIIRADRDAR